MKRFCKAYYPTHWSGCNPIHAVNDWLKVRLIIRALMRGETVNPIIIDGQIGNGNLITGTHRAAANDIIMMMQERGEWQGIKLVGAVSLEDVVDDYEGLREAVENNDFEAINDICDKT